MTTFLYYVIFFILRELQLKVKIYHERQDPQLTHKHYIVRYLHLN